jgi:CHAT domain-containing protein/uncharacterized protein HemY
MLRVAWLSAVLVLVAGVSGQRPATPRAPKPTPEVQKLFDTAAKLRGLDQRRVIQQAIELSRTLHDLAGEAKGLHNMGFSYFSFEEYRKAIEFYDLALPIRRAAGDLTGEGATLFGLGQASDALNQYDKALEYYRQALEIFGHTGDNQRASRVASAMGGDYKSLSRYADALAFYDRAFVLAPENEANVLLQVGNVYETLSQYRLALESYNRSQAIAHNYNTTDSEGHIARLIGVVYEDLRAYSTALQFLGRALTIATARGDTDLEAATRKELGRVYMLMGRYSSAHEYFERALRIYEEIPEPKNVAGALCNLGDVYVELKQYDLAIESYDRALPYARQTNVRNYEADGLDGIAQTLRKMGNAPLAIAFAKMGINVLQSIRADNRDLERTLQNSYREGIENRYRVLAGWLTDAGRLPEAEQVLGLLKGEEFFRYLGRRDGGAEKLDLTPRESEWLATCERLGGGVAEVSTKRDELRKIAPADLTNEQKAEFARLDDSLGQAKQAFLKFIVGVAQNYRAGTDIGNRLREIKGALEIQRALEELPKRAAAIYTLSTGNSVRIILTLPGGVPIVRQASRQIAAKELNEKIRRFRELLTDPRFDPRADGADLYDLLVRPIERDLVAGKAEVLMWSLDGALRYLPLAALYDRQTGKFLIEKASVCLFLPDRVEELTDNPKSGSAAGFGVSERETVRGFTFPALPSVAGEIAAVKSAFGGTVYDLDDQFTSRSFREGLHTQPRIVHVATHFHLAPGDDQSSFLLLGAGQTLTMAQIDDFPDDTFASVDTLTLSACQTGLGGDGREVESFARIAQRLGASSVIASLWSVSDESTAQLMGEFYHLRKTAGTKLEALRQAQLEMLRGAIGGTGSVAVRSEIGKSPAAARAKLWPAELPRFSHPYYWAPFVLTGNWK